MLQKGRVRTLDDVADVATLMIKAFAQGDIHPARSKEIRQWTELLYTTVAAKSPTQDTSVNFIAQLISLDTPVERPRTVVDVQANEGKNVIDLISSNTEEPQTLGKVAEPVLIEID